MLTCTATENVEFERADGMDCAADRADNRGGLAISWLTAGNAEDSDFRNAVLHGRSRRALRDRKVRSDRDEHDVIEAIRKPRNSFGRDREYGGLCLADDATHDVSLRETAEAIDKTRARIRQNIVKDDGDTGTRSFQDAEDPQKLLREPMLGPGKRGVLYENPSVAPLLCHERQSFESGGPAMDFPRDSADIQLNAVRLESSGKVAAIILDSVGGLIFLTKKCDGCLHSIGELA